MIQKLAVYISDSIDPYENLSIEKHLLDTTPADTVTLYLWQNQNTVVIGRNQNPWAECKCRELEADGGKLARRLSGGGAVFHDVGNLNFTFLCATENYDLQKQMKVIETACLLAGIKTELSGRNDILADGRKFSGNAFYNSKGKSYHHGTILINTDREKMSKYLTPPKAKLEAKGVKSVRSRVVNLTELSPELTVSDMRKYMSAAFETVYGLHSELLTVIDKNALSELVKQYSSWEYLYGTPLAFSISLEDRFSWGHINLQLQLKDGLIQSVKVFTDSMDWQLAINIESALIGSRFDFNAISKAIIPVLSSDTATDILNLLKNQVF